VPSLRHRYRVLYVGNNYDLLKALQDRLADLDGLVVRVPSNGVPEARLFLRSGLPYAVLLFDETLIGTSGQKLARFALSLDHRAGTPALIAKESDDVAATAERVRRLLGTGD
jgi:hypothetical protein